MTICDVVNFIGTLSQSRTVTLWKARFSSWKRLWFSRCIGLAFFYHMIFPAMNTLLEVWTYACVFSGEQFEYFGAKQSSLLQWTVGKSDGSQRECVSAVGHTEGALEDGSGYWIYAKSRHEYRNRHVIDEDILFRTQLFKRRLYVVQFLLPATLIAER